MGNTHIIPTSAPSRKDAPVTPPEHIIQFAIEASLNSPCQSKRGVAIWSGEDLVSIGWNYKPKPFVCDGSTECKFKCGKDAVHAEQHAIIFGRDIRGCQMLHVKTVSGVLVPSMGPSCLQCSKLILAVGISAMWLYHENGWLRYDPVEFHYLSGAYVPRIKAASGEVR
jgi:deoxycytidylate deaminase